MNNLRATIGALVFVLLGGCGEPPMIASADDQTGDAEKKARGGPGGRVVYSGSVEVEINDLSWTLTEFTPDPGVDANGFDMMLYGRAQGRFKDVTTFTAIPWDISLNTPIPLGEKPEGGTIGAYFVKDALNREGKKWVARSGTLTLTRYDEKLSGEFHAEFSQDGDKDVALTARGEFVDLPAIHRAENASGVACDAIEGKTFQSVSKHECGLTEQGVGHCRWTISFSSGEFHWLHSDVSERGMYTCHGVKIRGESTDRKYFGTYSPESRLLIWDGIEYES